MMRQVVSLDQPAETCLLVVEARGSDVVVLCESQTGVFVERQRLNFAKPSKVRSPTHTSICFSRPILPTPHSSPPPLFVLT